ncbi:hypothetical protein GII36_04715 [Candidatus Mycosynbacter amalyticus]|uniref:Type IV secretion system protein n=1 Tax=Candidatus Mycosynbacter amalyticus TaxID=2665156 RepID=A0A857MKK2_9BACT|nr:type IV secretion system protein [Candidatus Mycosynbacter amalyticus]QHN43124.1 hypothetical protein GII36_04715 [Candidatus Mycosynbacter amalyticus]
MKRLWSLIVAGLITVVLAVSLVGGTARAVSTTGIPSLLSQGSVSTCAYDNMGWIICPVLRATSVAGDYAFTFVSQNFLKVEVSFYNTQSGAAQAGAIMRTIANVLFVIAFLYIVYALITGRGIGNYNLKRLVPRFILAVIFVNLSYYICQIMVDLSNLLGVGIQQLLVDGVAKNIGASAMPLASSPGTYDVSPLADITSGVISKNEVAWVLLAPLTAVVMSATVICSALIIVLIVRKALVVMLILLAPLAFFAYLLPNTSDYFSRWLKLFLHMLLLFPIISFLIGAGQIVSASIIKAGGSDYQVDNDTIALKPAGQQSATLYLVAAGAAVLPLVGTWYAFKAATNAIDAAGARVSRDGLRRSSRERDEKAKKREQTAMDMNKKSMMLRGINRLQQLNVAKDGESNASIFGRVGGAYRGRGKHQTKTPEQARFDSQVQQRLSELRGGSEAGRSPQELYSQALQRYQDRMNGDAGSDGVNINSYEGIELKASEAFLLESLGKGVGVASTPGAEQQKGSKDSQSDEKDKKAAGISSLNRDGKSSGGNAQTPPPDPYHAPTTGGVTASAMTVAPSTGGGATQASTGGATIIVQAAQPSSGGTGDAQLASGTGFAPRRPSQNSNELLAKTRAAKYVAGAQDALAQQEDMREAGLIPKTPSDSDVMSGDVRLH